MSNVINANINHNKGTKSIKFFRFMSKMLKGDNIRLRRNIAPKVISKENANIETNIFKIKEPGISSKRDTHLLKKVHNKTNKSYGRSLADHIEEYCSNTTLHGLRYVGKKTLVFGERIFWFLAFCCAIGFGSYYITNVYDKWISSPVIISFSPFDADLSSIPFPAVTICNMNQAKKSEAEKLLAEGDPVQMKLLSDICNDNTYNNDTAEYSWSTLNKFLIRTGSSCTDLVKKCEWSGQTINCDDIFNNYLTDEGLCCSFNRLPPSKIFRHKNDVLSLNQTYPENVFDWNPENGFQGFSFPNESDDNAVPKRPLGAGSHLGLTVLVNAEVDNYYCSSTSSAGFKILISNPIESPKMAAFASLLRTGVETRYSIIPSVREASSQLRNVILEKRQCYFANEKELTFYRTYSQNNCNLECQSNYTFDLCGCIPYYLPRGQNVKVCGKADSNCVTIAKENMEKLTYTNITNRFCHCLPGCFELFYIENRSYSMLRNTTLRFGMNGMSQDYIRNNIAIINIFFPIAKFTKQIKRELYGFTDILANAGGLLGLCMGFSVLSIIELLYFVSLRLVCSQLKKQRSKVKKRTEHAYPFLE